MPKKQVVRGPRRVAGAQGQRKKGVRRGEIGEEKKKRKGFWRQKRNRILVKKEQKVAGVRDISILRTRTGKRRGDRSATTTKEEIKEKKGENLASRGTSTYGENVTTPHPWERSPKEEGDADTLCKKKPLRSGKIRDQEGREKPESPGLKNTRKKTLMHRPTKER